MNIIGTLAVGFACGVVSVGVAIGAFNLAEAEIGRKGATIGFMLCGGIAFAALLGAAHRLSDREAG